MALPARKGLSKPDAAMAADSLADEHEAIGKYQDQLGKAKDAHLRDVLRTNLGDEKRHKARLLAARGGAEPKPTPPPAIAHREAPRPADDKGPVLLPWVTKIPWRQQSILFSGLRGPDQRDIPALKEVIRWMRSVAQHDATGPSGDYAKAPDALPAFEDYHKELEHCSAHFVGHFANALRVIAMYAPDDGDRKQALAIHTAIAHDLFGFEPADDETWDWYHRDKV